MDKLLTNEQRLAIMEKKGCCKSGQCDRDCKAFAEEYKDGTITVSYGDNQMVYIRQDNLFMRTNKKIKTAVFCNTNILRLLCRTFFISLSKYAWS